MSQTTPAAAPTVSAYSPLPHRQEAFARHVASGRSFSQAARLSGYAWNSARQTGSRLMRDPGVAARVVELTAIEDTRRHAELDELVAAAKRVLLDAMEKQQHFAALRAIDQIARLRSLDGPQADARRAAFDDDPDDAEEGGGPVSSIADPDALFEPPMPPAVAAPVEPAPEDPEKAYAKAVKLQNRRYSKCYDLVMSRHPDIKARLRDAQDVSLYFDSEYRLLPPELWPAGKSPAVSPAPSAPAVSPAPPAPKMTNVDGSGHAPGGRAA
ncbi:terminase small subunit [Skermanella rosea]|uniref:terminase small subunit n=1 Tax=Skermanella rosea TaxID=1817965 RepID=UPI001933A762|nr:terminase small subunit [Skermanella rosea]UEM04495.1 terminase small subunit [Skermanella rosea]